MSVGAQSQCAPAAKPVARSFVSSAPKCRACQKSVYAAEQVIGPGRVAYHKPCLKCTSCAKRLDPFNVLDHDLEPYCSLCHSKHFGRKSITLGSVTLGQRRKSIPESAPTGLPTPTSKSAPLDPVRSATPPPGSAAGYLRTIGSAGVAPGTPEADRSVLDKNSFETPPMGPRQSRLPSILITPPASLTRPTEPWTVTDEDLDILTQDGYEEYDPDAEYSDEEEEEEEEYHYHPRPPSLSPLDIIFKPRHLLDEVVEDPAAAQTRSPTQTRRQLPSLPPIAPAPAPLSAPLTGAFPHHSPPTTDTPPLKSTNPRPQSSPGPLTSAAQLLSKSSPGSLPRRKSVSVLARGSQWQLAIAAAGGDGVGNDGPKACPRCAKVVYHAEQVLAVGKKWHKQCMRCEKCNKVLDSNLNERDGKPYCVRCYDLSFGAAAHGFILRPGFGTK